MLGNELCRTTFRSTSKASTDLPCCSSCFICSKFLTLTLTSCWNSLSLSSFSFITFFSRSSSSRAFWVTCPWWSSTQAANGTVPDDRLPSCPLDRVFCDGFFFAFPFDLINSVFKICPFKEEAITGTVKVFKLHIGQRKKLMDIFGHIRFLNGPSAFRCCMTRKSSVTQANTLASIFFSSVYTRWGTNNSVSSIGCLLINKTPVNLLDCANKISKIILNCMKKLKFS